MTTDMMKRGMQMANRVGDESFYIILNHGKDKYGSMIGDIGPYRFKELAVDAMEKIVASREGEKLLNLLGVERIRVRGRFQT
jgi:hypothetical protein